MTEKQILDYPNYSVTECGRIFKGSTEMKQHENAGGYMCVGLTRNKKKKKFLVHRLVALAFIENNDPARDKINHKDFDKTNNHVDNLEWVTHKENMVHAREGNRIPYKSGIDHHSSFLEAKDVLDIFNDPRSVEEIALDRELSFSTIQRIKNGKAYSMITGKKYDGIGSRKLTNDQISEILSSDESCPVLAKKFGVTLQTVARHRRKHNPEYRLERRTGSRFSPEDIAEIKTMPVRDAIRKYKISQTYVYHLRKHA